MLTQFSWCSPVGELLIASDGQHLVMCDWLRRRARQTLDTRVQGVYGAPTEGRDAIIDQTIHQLEAYFAGQLQSFDLPIKLTGTVFQQQVWQQLQRIPYGQTFSYAQLANALKRPEAVRAVANANGANALSIVVPCHRVIASDGSIAGYAGGVEAKHKLLALEGVTLS